MGNTPSLALAERVLPKPLLRAIRHVFEQRLEGCMLVGGTALAGFYAGHRRSDDIDLFTRREEDHTAAVLAVRSLSRIGAEVRVKQDSKVYLRAVCALDGLRFTADVASTPSLFALSPGVELEGGIRVAEAETLLALKGATLVSRASEKDLYDLLWLFEHTPGLTTAGLVAAAQRFDGGAGAENMVISLLGARLDRESCAFSLDPKLDAARVHRQLVRFKRELLEELRAVAKGEPPAALDQLAARIRALAPRD